MGGGYNVVFGAWEMGPQSSKHTGKGHGPTFPSAQRVKGIDKSQDPTPQPTKHICINSAGEEKGINIPRGCNNQDCYLQHFREARALEGLIPPPKLAPQGTNFSRMLNKAGGGD